MSLTDNGGLRHNYTFEDPEDSRSGTAVISISEEPEPGDRCQSQPAKNSAPTISSEGQREVSEKTLSEGAGEKLASLVVAGVNCYPTTIPPETVILGNGWVRQGDIITLISGAGGGKTVFAKQASIAWGLGLPYFGIKPPRPLRILMFSGEDDAVTFGQCREGFLLHSKAITGMQLQRSDLDILDQNLRTDFSREFVGDRFHAHLDRLLKEAPADLVIINPLLSYLGGEVVAEASTWLRAGLMPILQNHLCASAVVHHTPKLSKDSWDQIEDTYSGIGGGEIANIPRSILTLKPTPAEGLFVVTVSKRQTVGWKDGDGKFTPSYFVRRSDNPELPAWIPVAFEEAQELIELSRSTRAGGHRREKKATSDHVVAALRTGAMQRVALIKWLMTHCPCSDRPARNAIQEAQSLGLICEFREKSAVSGSPLKWFQLTEHTHDG
jgi:hypothetical protein